MLVSHLAALSRFHFPPHGISCQAPESRYGAPFLWCIFDFRSKKRSDSRAINFSGRQEAVETALTDARRLRRQRNLDRVEIPEDHVTVTDELLGKGGFGAVYLADFNGRNAAAKVRSRLSACGRHFFLTYSA